MGVVAQNRFRNSIYKLKKTADSGLAGKIRCAHVNSLWWRGHCYYDLWWRGTWEKEGGGPTLNHAVHHIDMINWIQGGLPTEVTSVLANVMHDNSEVEDLSFAALRYADGSVAEVTKLRGFTTARSRGLCCSVRRRSWRRPGPVWRKSRRPMVSRCRGITRS